jgi:hypothetical protein
MPNYLFYYEKDALYVQLSPLYTWSNLLHLYSISTRELERQETGDERSFILFRFAFSHYQEQIFFKFFECSEAETELKTLIGRDQGPKKIISMDQ